MVVNRIPHNRVVRVSFPLAISVTVAMALAYTAIDVMQFPEPAQSLLALLPAAISLAALGAAGFTREELNLKFAGLSRPGALALAGTTMLLLPILGSSTGWTGWQWLPALVYAPASGIAQELYFRSALLSGLQKAFRGRRALALGTHSLIFVGFHFRTFRSIPSLPLALLVAVVLFSAGLGWGWQVQRDRTVVWAMLQHGLFLLLMSMFAWGQ
jgi:membrane protease YdiL (CAAX protease family)